MTDEVKQEEVKAEQPAPPPHIQELLSLISSGIGTTLQLFQHKIEEASKSEDKSLELKPEEFMDAFLYGVSLMANQIKRGIVAVSMQEIQFLALLREHKKGLKPGEKLVLGKAQGENQAGLVGADGRPLNQTSGGLIVPGK
jgi:hypothetical protein